MARKAKIFFGANGTGLKTADDIFNEWMAEHSGIEVINLQYCQTNAGTHSIFLFYEDEPKPFDFPYTPVTAFPSTIPDLRPVIY